MKRFTIFGLVLAVAIVTGLNFADIASAQKVPTPHLNLQTTAFDLQKRSY